MLKWVGLIGLLLAASAGAQDLRECGGTPGLPSWTKLGVYSGTLGTLNITLELSLKATGPDPAWPHHSFYAGHADTLALAPFHLGKTLILQEQVWPEGSKGWVVTGCFTLEQAADGWRGSWKAPGAAKTLKVLLRPLNVARVPLQLPASPGLLKLRQTDPLIFLRLNRPWKVSRDGQHITEPLSGLGYPRPAGASAALGRVLQDRLLEHAAAARDCAALLPRGQEGRGGYSLRASVTLLTPSLLSVREDIDYYCGGAHPDGYNVGLILDRAGGRPVPLLSLWPGLTPARLKTLYLAGPAPPAVPACVGVLRDTAGGFGVYLSGAGLNVFPEGLPHVAAVCGGSVLVPYAQLQREANAGSPYYAELYKE